MNRERALSRHRMLEFGMADNDEPGALEKLLDGGWDYHDSESERLARELEAAGQESVAPGLLASFVHLSNHTIGEHLGDWSRAYVLGKRVLEGQTPTAQTARAWGRLNVAAILAGHFMEAGELELSYLATAGDEFGAALLDMRFMLAGALVGSKRTREGARLYRAALGLVGRVGQSALLDRTIAMASNNLGWELYEMPPRTPDENALMQLAAATSLEFWRKCGSWINVERGHYLEALVANVTGDVRAGLAHADAALAIIAANGNRPLDAALLHLARVVSLAALADTEGSTHALRDADAAAEQLATPGLKVQFDAERSRVIAAMR
jgi:hypothetical protein